ncbi:unnamed protein product [Ranitomeya imitator]|uniref:PiggyBac transposable element-derived protein domain-containing protein n=1 Tax=Ranitomeya imitator TaxID=111125 RepID=A0ABN9L014_9NEOB|nr:unnamed protein product [Ranitomeya imitator]
MSRSSQQRYSVEEAYAFLASDTDSEGEDPTFLYFSDSSSSSSHSSSSSSGPAEPPRRRRRTEDEARPTIAEDEPAHPTADPIWTRPPENYEPLIPDIVAESGIKFDNTGLTELDFFKVFFSEAFVNLMVEQTNLYARQFLDQNSGSSYSNWSPVDAVEMMQFWGLVLHMGILKKPELQQYWSVDILYNTPVFRMVMTRTRFEAIHKFLHYNDNARCPARDDPNFDRLFKVRPVIEHFNKKFAEVYVPQRDICVDESLIHFKGRLGFRQYLPSKRARYGIKLYKLCESASGYTHSFRVYEGKDSRIELPECPSILGVSGKIVWDLVHPLLDKGYHLYTDNFYSSIPLYKSLFARGTAACGTVRKNQRGLPKTLLGQILRKGESKAQCSDHLLVVKYKDKRDVLLLTTIHGCWVPSRSDDGFPQENNVVAVSVSSSMNRRIAENKGSAGLDDDDPKAGDTTVTQANGDVLTAETQTTLLNGYTLQ